jgi:arylsulfatase A-like enzyme
MQALQVPVLQTFRGKFTQFAQQETEIASTRFVVENALRMLCNRNLNVVLVHVPIPHPPGIWNPETQSFTLRASTYLDNLQLADKLLGDMRQVLEQTGDWDQSVILVSSDHPYRSFLLGPPDSLWGSANTVTHSPPKTQPMFLPAEITCAT